MPLDLVIYERDALRIKRHVNITQESAYYGQIREQWGRHLRQGFAQLPDPAWSEF
jgi:putative proteasome-type protease